MRILKDKSRHSPCRGGCFAQAVFAGSCIEGRGYSLNSHCSRNTLLTASQGEQGNMFDSKLGLGLRKRIEMKFLSLEKLSSHSVGKRS